MTNEIFYVIDIETTGLDTNSCEIIELSALKVKDFEIIDTFDQFVNIGHPLPKEIVEFNQKNQTGITDDVLNKAPSPNEVANNFKNFIGESPIFVGHNIVAFDIPVIKRFLKETIDYDLNPEREIDTLPLSRQLVKGSHKLETLYKKTPEGKEEKNLLFHTSLADTEANLAVYKWLLDLKNQNQLSVNRLTYWDFDFSHRLYVANNQDKIIYFDLDNQKWVIRNADISDADLETKVFDFAQVSNRKELLEKYAR